VGVEEHRACELLLPPLLLLKMMMTIMTRNVPCDRTPSAAWIMIVALPPKQQLLACDREPKTRRRAWLPQH